MVIAAMKLKDAYSLGFPGGIDGKESTCNAGDPGLIPGLGRSPGERNGYTLQYSGLENSMDCIVCCYVTSVVSDSLRPHESQRARPPCPSPTPRIHSDSRPSSQWCHPAISTSVVLFSSVFNFSQHQGLFQWVRSSHQVAKILELQHQSFQWIIRIDFL